MLALQTDRSKVFISPLEANEVLSNQILIVDMQITLLVQSDHLLNSIFHKQLIQVPEILLPRFALNDVDLHRYYLFNSGQFVVSNLQRRLNESVRVKQIEFNTAK